jgi:hypothetical protein
MKTFFVICPIGVDGSDERRNSDIVLDNIIIPAVERATKQKSDECVFRADLISKPGLITEHIIEKLQEVDVVIADITKLNANVMFELGIRHGLGKPYVLLCEEGQELPFDIKNFRTIFYEININKFRQPRQELSEYIVAAIPSGFSRSELSKTQYRQSTENPHHNQLKIHNDAISDKKIKAVANLFETAIKALFDNPRD